MHNGDVKEISAIISDIEVMHDWERAFTEKKDALDWIIKQYRRCKHEQVGYILRKDCFHKGYATEGATACLKYGFDLFDIPKITITVRSENTASIAVAKRLGMKLIGEYDKVYGGKVMKHFIYVIYKE